LMEIGLNPRVLTHAGYITGGQLKKKKEMENDYESGRAFFKGAHGIKRAFGRASFEGTFREKGWSRKEGIMNQRGMRYRKGGDGKKVDGHMDEIFGLCGWPRYPSDEGGTEQ